MGSYSQSKRLKSRLLLVPTQILDAVALSGLQSKPEFGDSLQFANRGSLGLFPPKECLLKRRLAAGFHVSSVYCLVIGLVGVSFCRGYLFGGGLKGTNRMHPLKGSPFRK